MRGATCSSADAAHRVGIYYPGLGPINAANFLNPNYLAPGMIAAMFTRGNFNQFGGQPIECIHAAAAQSS